MSIKRSRIPLSRYDETDAGRVHRTQPIRPLDHHPIPRVCGQQPRAEARPYMFLSDGRCGKSGWEGKGTRRQRPKSDTALELHDELHVWTVLLFGVDQPLTHS